MVPAPLNGTDRGRLRATVAELHGRDPFRHGAPAAPEVWWCDFTDAAIVLGSHQSAETLDPAAVAAAEVSVVRRRSGGGAVLLRPGAVVWIDLVVPVGFWPDDVRVSMVRAGELWRAALGDPALRVHTGGMVATPWSSLVCFAGVGPGEVLVDQAGVTRKLVGLSQRRTRHGVWIQGLVHTRPLVATTGHLMCTDVPGSPPEAAVIDVGAERLVRALRANLEVQSNTRS